ncbi:Glutathione transferase [Bertholletia excelsa]
MAEVKLIGTHGSPYSTRIEIALKLKGVKYEFINEDLANKSSLLLQYNPVHKKVPVLLHNGKPICESVVILEYIEETWKARPILPQQPYERAVVRFWVKFLDEKCLPALWKACWSRGKEQEKAIEEACDLLKTLEVQLKDKKFFGGDSIGLVDIAADFIGHWLGVLLEAAGLYLLTEEKFPILCRWINDFADHPVIKENLPAREMLLAFFKACMDSPTGFKY